MKKTNYIFNHFSGYGYGEISIHTIEFYKIEISANTLEEAIQKYKRKIIKVSRYNKCFRQDIIPIIKENEKEQTIGIFWTKDFTIKWQDETIYFGAQRFDTPCLQKFNIPKSEYPAFDSHFAKNYCTGNIYHSHTDWFMYVKKRFSRPCLLQDTTKEDIKKYYYDAINWLLTVYKDKLTPEEIEELKGIK